MDALAVMGLGREATESQIRERYLELVRQYPPEREPQRFAEIRSAYEELRDPVRSLERRLFQPNVEDSFEHLKIAVQQRMAARRLSLRTLAALAEFL